MAKQKKKSGATFVIAADGTVLMPTFNKKKVRTLLKQGKAKIYRYRPFFAIQLTYTPEKPQALPVECSFDTGDIHTGLSVKSEKHEYLSEQRDNLDDEKEMHDAQRKTRRARRNRKRYRAPRFDNRKKEKGTFAPSIRHKIDNVVRLAQKITEICPISDFWLELGSFDTAALAAIEAGQPLPQGTDYQQGPKYGHDTLREAVFYRDGHKCLVCGKSGIKDGAVLRLHHLGFRDGDHTDRMGNLATVCTKCHIPANHKEGGALWDFEPEIKPLKGAAFMNTARWEIYRMVRAVAEKTGAAVHITYGSITKRVRLDRNIGKSHANDAYCIGNFHPKHRSPTRFFRKKRRNNRLLQKFVDAVYTDIRDGSEKKGSEIGCNRDNRKTPRNNDKNERKYRGHKVSKGTTPIRKKRYEIRPGDPLLYKGRRIISAGVHCKGKSVTYKGVKIVPLSNITNAVNKKGEPLPFKKDKPCIYTGGKKPGKKKLLSMDEKGGTAALAWIYSVPVKDCTPLGHTGAWEEYFSEKTYIY